MWNIISNFVADFKMTYCVLMTIVMEMAMAIGVIGVAIVLLSVGVIFRRDHSFRSQHIHENARMKKDKIHCAISEDKLAKKIQNRKMDLNELD